MSTLDPTTARRLKDAAGPGGWSEDEGEIAPHLVELRGRWTGQTPLLLKPANTEAVSRILAICNETGTAVVPQGGNTGLVGGQIPTRGEVLLSLERMTRIRNGLADDDLLVAEAGVVLKRVQQAAESTRSPVSSEPWRGRFMHDRRQRLDQRGRRQCAALRHDARARARARSGARRWPRARPAARAQEGQHRLRPQAALHRRRRHARDRHRRRR